MAVPNVPPCRLTTRFTDEVMSTVKKVLAFALVIISVVSEVMFATLRTD